MSIFAQGDSINQMRMLKIAELWRLVAVYNSGLVALWDPLNIEKVPLVLMCVMCYKANAPEAEISSQLHKFV